MSTASLACAQQAAASRRLRCCELDGAVTAPQSTRVAVLERAPSTGLVLGAIASVQFGSALAATLFSRIGPAGAVTLRLAAAAVILAVLWPPRTRGRTRRELQLAVVFGLVLAG